MHNLKTRSNLRDVSPRRHPHHASSTMDSPPVPLVFEFWTQDSTDCSVSTLGRRRKGNTIVDNGSCPNDTPETYRTHPSFSTIQVSTLGNIRRGTKNIGKSKGPKLALLEAGLRKSGDPKRCLKRTLVAETFLGLPPSRNYLAKCIDGNVLNLRLSNIIWECNRQVFNLAALPEEENGKWKPIPQPYSKYFYSIDGQIRREDWILKPSINHGRPIVNIQNDDGTYQTKSLSVLIAFAEYGPRESINFDVAHLDDNPHNCSPANLEYQSKTDNMRQAASVRKQPIKATSSDGFTLLFESVREAALKFGTKPGAISNRCARGNSFEWDNKIWTISKNGEPIRKSKHRKQEEAPLNRQDWVQGLSEHLSGYEFLPDGRVRKIGASTLLTPFLLAGYLVVNLRLGKVRVHRAILEVFHGPSPSSDHHGDHIDEHKTHNCRSNLMWNTKNVERSCGQPCERWNGASWERFNSVRAAAIQITKEQNRDDSMSDQKFLRATKMWSSCIRRVLKHQNDAKTAGGYKWQALKRGPDFTYVCSDCHKEYTRRGDWISSS